MKFLIIDQFVVSFYGEIKILLGYLCFFIYLKTTGKYLVITGNYQLARLSKLDETKGQ